MLGSLTTLIIVLILFGSISSIALGQQSYSLVTSWGSEGVGEGQFKLPHGVDIDSSGNVYVVDTGNFRVQKFDSNGKFITMWGSRGSEKGQFDDMHGIDVDSSNNVYVSDSNNHRIQKFDSNG